MTEQEFADSFHAKFPYRDKEAAAALIHQGWAISPNAAFCVLHEICRPPLGAESDIDLQNELLDCWLVSGDHPLKPSIVACAIALINDRPLPWQAIVELMKKIDRFPDEYAALAVAYSASDCESTEGNAALDNEDDRIRRRWAHI